MTPPSKHYFPIQFFWLLNANEVSLKLPGCENSGGRVGKYWHNGLVLQMLTVMNQVLIYFRDIFYSREEGQQWSRRVGATTCIVSVRSTVYPYPHNQLFRFELASVPSVSKILIRLYSAPLVPCFSELIKQKTWCVD